MNILSLKCHIPLIILRQFFLCQNFVRSLVFKLQEEIAYHGLRIGDGQERRLRLDADALRTGRTEGHTLKKKNAFTRL